MCLVGIWPFDKHLIYEHISSKKSNVQLVRTLLRLGGGGDCAAVQEREQHLQVPQVSRR